MKRVICASQPYFGGVEDIYDYIHKSSRRLRNSLDDKIKQYVASIESDGDDFYLSFSKDYAGEYPTILFYHDIRQLYDAHASKSDIDTFIVDRIIDTVYSMLRNTQGVDVSELKESYIDIEVAECCDMQFGETTKEGIHAAYWRPAMSYLDGFRYYSYFTDLGTKLPRIIAENKISPIKISRIFEYQDNPEILLIASPKFNFLTTQTQFATDIGYTFDELLSLDAKRSATRRSKVNDIKNDPELNRKLDEIALQFNQLPSSDKPTSYWEYGDVTVQWLDIVKFKIKARAIQCIVNVKFYGDNLSKSPIDKQIVLDWPSNTDRIPEFIDNLDLNSLLDKYLDMWYM